MLALSTSWKSKQINNGELLIQLIEDFDVTGIELEYRISAAIFRQVKKRLKRSDLKVVSIHNYFPIPDILTRSGGGGDLFLLSHTDKEERQRAIQMTIRSIEHANDLEAFVVILHCGYVAMNAEVDVLYRYWEENQIHTEAAQTFIGQKLKERDHLKKNHLDSLLFSLDRLIRVAEKQNIILGIENRYHYHELPGLEDFRMLFAEFEGGPVGYWHDTGHAYANEILTLIPSEALLKTYSEHLIGIHLHDAVGIADHLAPGTGEVDFDRIKFYLKNDPFLVLELKPGTPDAEVSQGIQFIRNRLFDEIESVEKDE